jgi:C4-dicarboxylate-specific signal transduction histidine kinase
MRAPCHRHRRLTVSTARDGDRVLVEIGDNGPGIPEAAAVHVLESFYTTKPVGHTDNRNWHTDWSRTACGRPR